MLIVIAALLSVAAFLVLMRLVWLSARPARHTTVITLAAAVLVIGLALLAATGRLHWLAAVAAAVFPFLRRGIGLLRYVPLLRSLLGSGGGFGSAGPFSRRGGAGGHSGSGASGAGGRSNGARGRAPPGADAMTRERALEILGLGIRPTREEVLAAHRRLIQKLHPDRGGSKYLAQQLNEAKARLLDEL